MLWAGNMLKTGIPAFFLMSYLGFRHTNPGQARNINMPDANRIRGRRSGILMLAIRMSTPS